MTGEDLFATLRMRVSDQGDDTQDFGGTPDPRYHVSDEEVRLFLNSAKDELFLALVEIGAFSELRNVIDTTTSSTLPDACYAPFSATIEGEHAVLFDDPRMSSSEAQSVVRAVTIYGTEVVRSSGNGHEVWYFKRPSAIVKNGTLLTQFTDQFYEAVIDLAEQRYVSKESARARTVMRRKFGEEDVQMFPVQEYLKNAE